MMANVFPKGTAPQASTLEIVRETLGVNGEGNVTFRCRRGRGSGKAVEIPGSQFDEFVTLMVQTRDSREALAQQQRAAEAKRAAETATSNTTTDSE